MTYCIYTDKETLQPSPEHIIPLSLGGHDEFTIQVDRNFNNEVGSKVDGKLANDFAILFDRNKTDVRGHSGKPPVPTAKRATLADGTPVQALLGKDGLKIFDLNSKKILSHSESNGQVINCSGIALDIDIDLMFVAKVALAAGYFAYGENFSNYVETDEFRKIMNLNKNNFPSESAAVVYSRFHHPEQGDENFHILKFASEIGGCSSVIMVPSEKTFGVAVAVLGKFVGFVSVPSNSSKLPNEEIFKFGHCIYLQSEKVKRFSFDHIREKMLKIIS